MSIVSLINYYIIIDQFYQYFISIHLIIQVKCFIITLKYRFLLAIISGNLLNFVVEKFFF